MMQIFNNGYFEINIIFKLKNKMIVLYLAGKKVKKLSLN